MTITSPESPQIPAEPLPPSSKTPLWISLAAVAGLLVGVVGTLGAVSVSSTIAAAAEQSAAESAAEAAEAEANNRLSDAVDKCGSSAGVDLADEDRTLVMDVKGEEDSSGAPYSYQACILQALDVPASVESHIGQTTSLDGRQSESWDGITIEWSYHPDRGSDMVITIDSE